VVCGHTGFFAGQISFLSIFFTVTVHLCLFTDNVSHGFSTCYTLICRSKTEIKGNWTLIKTVVLRKISQIIIDSASDNIMHKVDISGTDPELTENTHYAGTKLVSRSNKNVQLSLSAYWHSKNKAASTYCLLSVLTRSS